jgi:probable HAF family extracellular repeat protein
LIIAAALVSRPATAQPVITDLGALPGGNNSFATALSADGTTVSGGSNSSVGSRAFRWTAAGGMQNLGLLPSGGSSSTGEAISADGSVIAGINRASNNENRAFRWTAAGGMTSLGVLGTGSASAANAISADGSVVAGSSYTSVFTNPRAFRWTSAGGMQNLGVLPGGASSSALAISADGSVVAGSDVVDGLLRAFRWTSAGGMQDLGILPGADSAEALGMSADGSVVTGDSGDQLNNTYFHAFRWTAAGGMQDLGALPGGTFSQGSAISGDNSIIVGASSSSSGDRAFLWTSTLGMLDLNEYLSSLGADLTDWRLTSATDISADGSVIAGTGTFNGQDHAFLVVGVVPEPSSVMLLIGGAFCLYLGWTAVRRRQCRTEFGAGLSTCRNN